MRPGGSSARLFVALDLPAAAREALVAWRAPIVAGRGGALRAVPPEALHVTLCFLGSLPLAEVDAVGEAVARVDPPAQRVGGLSLGEALWLPRRRPRVLTVAVADEQGALGRLHAAVVRALAGDGGWLEPEARPYLPHVTVARVRERGPAEAAALAREPLAPPPALAFAGTALTLYRSHLGGGPARYEPIVRVALR